MHAAFVEAWWSLSPPNTGFPVSNGHARVVWLVASKF